MWKCFQNNIHITYLEPHSSHVVQPLDVAVFSRLKASYRAQIEALTQFEDSAPIKKIRFVEYYNAARTEALSESYIKSAWRGAGLFPWNPQKVLNSKQILKKQDIPLTTPTTPRKRRRESPSLFETPQN